MKAHRLRALMVFALVLLTGCSTRALFEDVSPVDTYRSYVGATFILKSSMHLSGVDLPPGYRNEIDLYLIDPPSPGWAGRELITRETLPSGTTVVVESVQRCRNCFLDFKERIEARVRITGREPSPARPVTISLAHLHPPFAELLRSPASP